MSGRADVLVAGAGIAGSSIASALVGAGAGVILLERETRPGYHSTGRSAAMLTETYGTTAVRQLARASRGFLQDPPEGFAGQPLLSPRGMLHVARRDQRLLLEQASAASGAALERLDGAAISALAPIVRADYADAGLYEPGAMAIDVAALHQGYLGDLGRRGGRVVTDAEITAITRVARGWRITTRAGDFEGAVLVDAAGAWADRIATLAGLAPLGLVAKRRTALLLDPPEGLDPRGWPMVIDVAESFYFKPEAAQLLVSPGDETPVAPGDVQPEELDVAVAIDRYERVTGRHVRRIARRWAGLRTFAADHDPVVGPDPRMPDFHWLAGQGGFGIMTAPALARIGASLITAGTLPADVDLPPGSLSPARLARA